MKINTFTSVLRGWKDNRVHPPEFIFDPDTAYIRERTSKVMCRWTIKFRNYSVFESDSAFCKQTQK